MFRVASSSGNGLLQVPNPIEFDPTEYTLDSRPETLVTSTLFNILYSTNIGSMKEIAILCSTNKNVQDINELVLSILASPEHIYLHWNT